VQENRKKRAEAARASGTGIRPDGTVTMRPTEAASILGEVRRTLDPRPYKRGILREVRRTLDPRPYKRGILREVRRTLDPRPYKRGILREVRQTLDPKLQTLDPRP
jgi:hypothetical protein